LPSWGQESAGQHCENGKLSTEVAELAQAVTQRNAPLAPGEKVAPPNGFSVEKLPKTVQDAVRAGTMWINEKAEVLVYIDMPAPIWGAYLNQLSSLGRLLSGSSWTQTRQTTEFKHYRLCCQSQ